METIPKVIFQTWKDQNVPAFFQEFDLSWRANHQEYKFELWTDEQNETFIADNYSEFLPIYRHYPYEIQRVDAIRYFLLYHYGGIYVDLDNKSLKNISPLIEDCNCFFGIESTSHNENFKVDMIASNALMGCVKKHPFFLKIIEELFRQKDLKLDRNQTILLSTGPFMLNRIFANYTQNDVTLLDHRFVSPLSYQEAEQYMEQGETGFEEQLAAAYCIHLHWGTWWKNQAYDL